MDVLVIVRAPQGVSPVNLLPGYEYARLYIILDAKLVQYVLERRTISDIWPGSEFGMFMWVCLH